MNDVERALRRLLEMGVDPEDLAELLEDQDQPNQNGEDSGSRRAEA